MTDFIDDNADLPADMVDLIPKPLAVSDTSWFGAAKHNAHRAALLSTRTALVASRTKLDNLHTINVKDHGAKGDGATDDWSAIQGVFDSLSSLPIGAYGVADSVARAPTVYFPPGVYRHSKPFFVRHGVRIEGSHNQSSILWPMLGTAGDATLYAGDNMVVGADPTLNGVGPVYGTSPSTGGIRTLKTGYGNSVGVQAGAGDFFYDLAHCPSVRLDADSSGFTITKKFRMDASNGYIVGDFTSIIRVGGALVPTNANTEGDPTFKPLLFLSLDNANDPAVRRMAIQFRGGSASTTTIFQRVQTASFSEVTAGVWYEVKVSWDGSHLRVFVNGELWTNGAFTQAGCTGQVTQYPWEHYYEGSYIGISAVDAGNDMKTIKGDLDWVHIEKGVSVTATYTPSASKPTAGANSMLLLDFEHDLHGCAQGVSLYPSGRRTVYLTPWAAQTTNFDPVYMHDLAFSNGTGVYFDFTSQRSVSRVSHANCEGGWVSRNNSFFSSWDDVSIQGVNARWGLYIQADSYCTMNNLRMRCRTGYLLREANVYGTSVNVSADANCWLGMFVYGGIAHHIGFETDSEVSTVMLASLLYYEPLALRFTASTLSNSLSTSAASACVIAAQEHAADPISGITLQHGFHDCFFLPTSGHPVVKVADNSGAVTWARQAVAYGSVVYGTPSALSTSPKNFSFQERQAPTWLKGLSSTDTQAKNLCGTATIPSGADHVAVAFATAEADTSYRVPGWIAKNKTTAGFDLYSPGGTVGADTAVDWMLVR